MAHEQSISPLFMPVCLNCSIYSWEHVKIPSPYGPFYMKELSADPLLRCSQCKMAHYCDKDCQLEHWENVHKERCKYSRGDKAQKAGVHAHLASSCPACKEETVVGTAFKSKDDNHWGCHLNSRNEFWANPTHTFRGRDGNLYDVPLGMEVGELTLNFSSRAEHVVSLLQKILYKMQVTKHQVSKKNKFQELEQELFFLRHDFLMKAAIIPPGKLVYHSHSVLLSSGKQSYILDLIRALGNNYSDNTQDTWRLWDAFILIFDYFLDNIKDGVKDFEDLGWKVKDKKMKGVMEQVERAAKVQEKWEQVVAALSQGVAPYYTLLEIILGSLQQECSICKTKIKIESTYGDHPSGSIKERRPVAICQGSIFKFHCGNKTCREKVVEKHTMDQVAIAMSTIKYVQDHKKDRCDWCSTMRRNVHRCSRCLTKVYCSQECLNMDWKTVHRKVCRKEPDPRKLKTKTNSKVSEKKEEVCRKEPDTRKVKAKTSTKVSEEKKEVCRKEPEPSKLKMKTSNKALEEEEVCRKEPEPSKLKTSSKVSEEEEEVCRKEPEPSKLKMKTSTKVAEEKKEVCRKEPEPSKLKMKTSTKVLEEEVCGKETDPRKLKTKKSNRVLEEEELPDTITLKDGTTMHKRSTPAVIRCPVAPCPDPRKDRIGFYRHELLLYVPWGAPGQPDFRNMSDTAVQDYYANNKKHIQVASKKHNGMRHFNEKGEEIVYDGYSIMKLVD